jgi:hypothetical protein
MRRDPADRYSSVTDLAAALEPFSGGSSVVRVDDLVALSPEQRANAERHGSPPELVTTAVRRLGPRSSGRPSWRRHLLVVAACALALAAAGAGLLVWSAPERSARAPAPPTPVSSWAKPTAELAGSPIPSVSARVRVSPDTASVTVDGRTGRLDDGVLELNGAPGDVFNVVASAGHRTVEVKVVITKEGTPSVDHIDLPDEAASPGTKGPATTPPGDGKSGRGGAGPTADVNAAGPGTAVPTGKAKAKEDW